MFDSNQKYIPLSERLRPRKLSEVIGQSIYLEKMDHFVKLLKTSASVLFYSGALQGVGKTTLSKIIAEELDLPHYQLSAIDAGVKEVKTL